MVIKEGLAFDSINYEEDFSIFKIKQALYWLWNSKFGVFNFYRTSIMRIIIIIINIVSVLKTGVYTRKIKFQYFNSLVSLKDARLLLV
jgi:hypothetical protein